MAGLLILSIDIIFFYFRYLKDEYIPLRNILAGGVFIIAALTDLLDGYIARQAFVISVGYKISF